MNDEKFDLLIKYKGNLIKNMLNVHIEIIYYEIISIILSFLLIKTLTKSLKENDNNNEWIIIKK